MHTRLQVLQPTDNASKSRQDCHRCANKPSCWQPGISDRLIVTNLLVCRIRRGIEVNRSTKLLLELLKPKLILLAQEIINATKAQGVDRETVFADLQSETIYQLTHRFVMGEIGYPLHYLFNVPAGTMRRYVSNVIAKHRKFSVEIPGLGVGSVGASKSYRNHVDMLVDDGDGRIGRREITAENAVIPDETLGEHHIAELATHLNEVIDDGLTLKLPEYRVMRFCLDNASDAKRPLNGLHIYMARVLGPVRSRITCIFSTALAKTRDAISDTVTDAEINEALH